MLVGKRSEGKHELISKSESAVVWIVTVPVSSFSDDRAKKAKLMKRNLP